MDRDRNSAHFGVIYTFFCHIKRRFALHKANRVESSRVKLSCWAYLGWVGSDIPQSAINMRATDTHTHIHIYIYTHTGTYVMAHLNFAKIESKKRR